MTVKITNKTGSQPHSLLPSLTNNYTQSSGFIISDGEGRKKIFNCKQSWSMKDVNRIRSAFLKLKITFALPHYNQGRRMLLLLNCYSVQSWMIRWEKYLWKTMITFFWFVLLDILIGQRCMMWTTAGECGFEFWKVLIHEIKSGLNYGHTDPTFSVPLPDFVYPLIPNPDSIQVMCGLMASAWLQRDIIFLTL